MPASLLHSHWLIPNELSVNGLPTSASYPILWQLGIRAILTLCADQEGAMPDFLPTYPFAWQRFVLPDSRYPEKLQPEDLGTAVEIVRTWTMQTLPVHIHCRAGIERSPLVAVTYLCAYHRLEIWEALNLVKQKHPRTAIRPEQLQVLRTYLKHVCR
jgi:atypical dual specificity phosphatase